MVPRRSPPEELPTVRIDLTAGHPIEFLPGRLEIVSGLPSDQEFRFHRPAGSEGAEFTLGRAPGPWFRHIQLAAPTVSRHHARLRFAGERWVIENLSDVNPLCVNGLPLTAPHTLAEGDELQVGAVVLRYRDGRG
jgi:pSer/pThr/pTyr-binding forkhead associated (FHA) protein